MLLMYVNIAVIIRFVFFPMERVDGRVQPLVFDPGAMFPPKVNLIPFKNLFDYESPRKTALNLIGNICMFIPTGIILPIIYKRLDRFWKVLITGALISLCIEIMQLPLNVRTSDVNDLILNTSGVVLGFLIYAAVRAIVRRRRGSEQSSPPTA